jgi:RNA polymerase sigma factor (sigma-70 family)
VHGDLGSLEREYAVLSALCAGEDAWPEFLDLFISFIHHELAQAGIKPGHDQADLVQEIALKLVSRDFIIIRRFLKHDTGYSFKAVLRTIIRSTIIDQWRRNRRWRHVSLDGEPALASLIASDGNPDPAFELYRESRLLSAFIYCTGSRDSVGFRALFLRFIEEQSVEEIGRELGLSANAVSQRLRYYLRKLRASDLTEVFGG